MSLSTLWKNIINAEEIFHPLYVLVYSYSDHRTDDLNPRQEESEIRTGKA